MTENDNLIIQKLQDDKSRLGVFGFLSWAKIEILLGAKIDGVLLSLKRLQMVHMLYQGLFSFM